LRRAQRGPTRREGASRPGRSLIGYLILRSSPAQHSTEEALTVEVDPEETARLVKRWQDADINIPLKVVAVPRSHQPDPGLRPQRAHREPRDAITVYIPEYVVGHWWEQILHNQSALRLKSRLLFAPGVSVTSVPYLLKSSAKAERRAQLDDAADRARRSTWLNG
jgi:hypothetical protein